MNYRRGIEQRLASQASQDEGVEHSALASLLLLKFAWGELAATTVQEIAHAAQQDGAHHAEIRRPRDKQGLTPIATQKMSKLFHPEYS